ncbi:hypothetical protein QTP88_010854 [Uroleucon formosanum]
MSQKRKKLEVDTSSTLLNYISIKPKMSTINEPPSPQKLFTLLSPSTSDIVGKTKTNKTNKNKTMKTSTSHKDVTGSRSGSIGDSHRYLNFGIFMSTPTTPASASAAVQPYAVRARIAYNNAYSERCDDGGGVQKLARGYERRHAGARCACHPDPFDGFTTVGRGVRKSCKKIATAGSGRPVMEGGKSQFGGTCPRT